ncbi:MAG: hypothetical protein DRP86_02560 [Candidatus Neomarinimicrobiota bacterium]|nr:hypothetical protein [Candidatus Neomarinimicrobiota bacterium]RKY51058.1 MAG: hypothetical protein DRP86_02560 [Candidatus Neomarinimicrobiota bacterium]
MTRLLGYIIAIYVMVIVYRRWIRPDLIRWLEKHQKNPSIRCRKSEQDPYRNDIPKEDIVDVDYKEEEK